MNKQISIDFWKIGNQNIIQRGITLTGDASISI
jgi:hypothetical protein